MVSDFNGNWPLLFNQQFRDWCIWIDLFRKHELILSKKFSLFQLRKGNLGINSIDSGSIIFGIINQELQVLIFLSPTQLVFYLDIASSYQFGNDHICYNLIITKMRSTGVNRGQIWLKKCNQKSKTTNLMTDFDFDELSALKKQAKRISIMTRMEERSKTKEYLKPKIRPMSSVQRSSIKRGDMSFKAVQKQYKQEKSLFKEALQKTAVERQKQQGLLGEIQRYESMNKQQLIQKLISLEHLANTIFKRNKYLEEELQKVKVQKQF